MIVPEVGGIRCKRWTAEFALMGEFFVVVITIIFLRMVVAGGDISFREVLLPWPLRFRSRWTLLLFLHPQL